MLSKFWSAADFVHKRKKKSHLPVCVSNFKTFSNPSSPPQAMKPWSLFQEIHLNRTLPGIAIWKRNILHLYIVLRIVFYFKILYLNTSKTPMIAHKIKTCCYQQISTCKKRQKANRIASTTEIVQHLRNGKSNICST